MAKDLPEEVNKYQKTTETQPARHWCFPPKSDVVPSNQSNALPVPALNFTADANQSNDSVPGRLLGVYKERQVRSLSFGGLARIRLRLGEP